MWPMIHIVIQKHLEFIIDSFDYICWIVNCARGVLGALAMKGYTAFPKAQTWLELHHLIVYCLGEYHTSAEMLSAYSTAAAEWANLFTREH